MGKGGYPLTCYIVTVFVLVQYPLMCVVTLREKTKQSIGMYAGGVPNLIMRQLAVSVYQACKTSYTSLSVPKANCIQL